MRSSRSSISFNTALLNARWSANGGSTYQRMKRRRNSFTAPALPTTGRSAEIAHIRSADRPVVGKAGPVKLFLRRFMRWYVEPPFADQRAFNNAVLRLIDDLDERVKRLERLEK